MISIYPIWLCIQNCLVNWDYTYISMASNDKLKCMCTCASLHLSFLSLILIIFCIILCIIIHRLDYTKIYTIQEKGKKWCFFQFWCEVKETSNFNTQAEWRHTWETEKKNQRWDFGCSCWFKQLPAHSRNTHRTKPTKAMHTMTVVKWNTPFQMHPRYIIIHVLPWKNELLLDKFT